MMKAKRIIVSLGCLVFTLFSTMAHAEKISIEDKWDNTIDNRSLSSSPTLIKEGNVLLILSDKVLENVSIEITNSNKRQINLCLTDITINMEYVIPINMLPTGSYYITVMQGTNYVIGYFSVNE